MLVRSPDRLWRGLPEEGVLLPEREVPNLEVLDSPRWRRIGGAWEFNDPADRLSRYVDAWAAWRDREDDQVKSQRALDAIRDGRRETKSKKPPHRPPWVPIPAALEAARACLASGGSQRKAVEAYREAAGYYNVTDETARAKRDASRTVLMQHLQPTNPV